MAARGHSIQSLNLPHDVCRASVIPWEAGIFSISCETHLRGASGAIRIGTREEAAAIADAANAATRDKTAQSHEAALGPIASRCTLSPYRQGELNGRARADIARGPYPSPVGFDDRTADR